MRSPGGGGTDRARAARGTGGRVWTLVVLAGLVVALVAATLVTRRRAPATPDVRPAPRVPEPAPTAPDPVDPPTDPRLPRVAAVDPPTDPRLPRVPLPAGLDAATDPGLRLPPARPDPAPHGPGAWSPAPAGLLTAPAPAPPAPVEAAPRHRWGLGAYVVAEVVFVGVSALLALVLLGGEETASAGTLVALVAVPTLAAAATAVLITYWRGNGPRLDLGLRWRSRDLALGLAFGFGGLFVTIPAAAIYVSLMGDDVSSAVGVLFGDVRATPLTAVLVFLVVAFVAPLCEEILYRGLLWGGITRLGAGPWVTLAVTTVIFALAHFEFERAPLLLVVAIPIGLARVYTDGLLAPIVAHQVNNLLPGIGLMLLLLGVLPEV